MRKFNLKKVLSLILVVIMLFTAVPAGVFATQKSYPVMMAFTAASSGDFHKYYSKVYSVTFLDEIDTEAMNASLEKWDISADKGSGKVMSWMYLNEEATARAGDNRYDVYIAGDGGVAANAQSGFIFYLFSELVEVNGMVNFKTDNATTFKSMFENCYKLEKVSIDGWNTENLTSMENMFRNCYELTELNLSSFNTGKVTTMRFMFYLCKKLQYIYAGDGWTNEAIINLNDGVFNCCYAKFGGQEEYEKNPNPPVSAYYATHEENGGYITKAYNVRYEFSGEEIPENVTVPEKALYEAGSKVDVADTPSAEGYVFSGWTTDDADITKGSFDIYNDVVIVGTWIKINYYDVTYKFIGDTPDGVTTPEKVTYEEGDEVFVESEPYVNGYIFSGWKSTDADITGGKFNIYNDVEIVGKWSKLYKVNYAYDTEYTTPVGAPDLPDSATYQAGEIVEVEDVLFLDKYDFTGWYVKDADVVITGDAVKTFTMPQKDITLYGRFEKSVVPVDGIIADKTEFNLEVGDKEKITVTVTPDDATEKGVTYESSDESVVKVDENGNIEAVGDGEATITVTSKGDTNKKVSIKVKVKKPVVPVEKVEADKTEFDLEVGDKEKITVTVTPDDATEKGVTYESDNESVVKVDENGNIEAVGDGEATITVTSKDDSNKKVSIKVKVKKPVVPVEKVEADKTEFDLEVGDKDKITVTVTPHDATEKGVTYESDNESVVKVDENGNIEAVGDGEATITVTSKGDTNKKVSIKVKVKKPVVPVEKVEADKTEFDLEVGDKDKITVTVTPDDATEKGVTYESSDESVVKVDKNGNIEAVGDGEATITVTSKGDTNKKVSIKVKVKKPVVPVEKVEADKTEFDLEVGDKEKITVTVTPDDATEKGVTYESSDETVVKVDENGNIEAIGDGEATITVTSKGDTNKNVSIKVKVNKPEETPDVDYPETEYIMEYPMSVVVQEGETKNLGVKVIPAEGAPAIKYTSSDESIVTVGADGNITGVAQGRANITAELPGGNIAVIAVTVSFKTSHYIVFGKTEKIGWYSVSMDGGETFMVVFGNSNLEVAEGTELIIRANDVLGDPFTFYINGNAATPDENGYVTVVVDGYMLIGALGIPVIAPDAEESLNLIQRLIKSIREFFAKIASWFGF